MKQRLLLALLVLFASVGMVQADTEKLTITIPADAAASKGSVKISATGTGGFSLV
ncbi:MAG: hypothetical protein LUD46_02460 [Parabacteroides sp.]|nr:hypothetical protein [Parabacteroides sp.]